MKKTIAIWLFLSTLLMIPALWSQDNPQLLSAEDLRSLMIGKWDVKHVALEGTEEAEKNGFELWDERAVFYDDGDFFKAWVNAKGGGDFVSWEITEPCYQGRPFTITTPYGTYEILVIDNETLLVSDVFAGKEPTKIEVWKKTDSK